MAGFAGYQSYCVLQEMTTPSIAAPSGIVLPITGANFFQAPNINVPPIVGGVTSPINFTEVQRRQAGSFQGPLFLGQSQYWAVVNMGISQRHGGQIAGTNYTSDDAQASIAYNPKALWLAQFETATTAPVYKRFMCKTLRISGTQGGLVEYSVDGQAYTKDVIASSFITENFTPVTSSSNVNYSPIPFWNTQLEYDVTGSGGGSAVQIPVTQFEITLNNNTIETFANAGTTTATDALNVYRLNQGQLTATGSFTLATPITLASASGSNYLRFRLTLGLSQGSGGSPKAQCLIFPNCVLTQYAVPLPGPNTRITRQMAFSSLGDGTQRAIYPADYVNGAW